MASSRATWDEEAWGTWAMARSAPRPTRSTGSLPVSSSIRTSGWRTRNWAASGATHSDMSVGPAATRSSPRGVPSSRPTAASASSSCSSMSRQRASIASPASVRLTFRVVR